jgi:NADH-quinone oxidoreductase subunit E
MPTLTKEKPASLKRLLEKHERRRSSIIPILQSVQAEHGYIPPGAIMDIARYLKIPEAEIYGVATFYAQFKFSPIGRNVITVCRGTACHVRGSLRLLREMEKELGIHPGETTEDLEFSLETVACLGSCALAPVMVANGKVYGGLTTNKARSIIGKLRNNGRKHAGGSTRKKK